MKKLIISVISVAIFAATFAATAMALTFTKGQQQVRDGWRNDPNFRHWAWVAQAGPVQKWKRIHWREHTDYVEGRLKVVTRTEVWELASLPEPNSPLVLPLLLDPNMPTEPNVPTWMETMAIVDEFMKVESE